MLGRTLKRAAVDLWDNEANTPDAAPTLWEDIDYRDGIRVIPETITVGLAFAKGEKGWWGMCCMRPQSTPMSGRRRRIRRDGKLLSKE